MLYTHPSTFTNHHTLPLINCIIFLFFLSCFLHIITSAAMSPTPTYVEEFPFEKLLPSMSNILIVGLVEYLFFILLHLLIGKKSIYTFVWGLNPSVESQLASRVVEGREKDRGAVADDRDIVKQAEKRGDQGLLRRGDADVVLRSLGLFSDGGGEAKSFDADEVFEMFEEESPRLEEVKEAFDVFDEDRDGFIDAEELQRVLCGLGFSEGLRLENCKRMIGVIDENGDGRLDFGEFVRLMESGSSSC